jgi:hypothetical protein
MSYFYPKEDCIQLIRSTRSLAGSRRQGQRFFAVLQLEDWSAQGVLHATNQHHFRPSLLTTYNLVPKSRRIHTLSIRTARSTQQIDELVGRVAHQASRSWTFLLSPEWLLRVVGLRSTKTSNASPSLELFGRRTGAPRAVQKPLSFPERGSTKLDVPWDFDREVPVAFGKLADVSHRLSGLEPYFFNSSIIAASSLTWGCSSIPSAANGSNASFSILRCSPALSMPSRASSCSFPQHPRTR